VLVKKILGLGVLAMLCLMPTAASAATLDFTGMGKNEIVTIAGERAITAYAGELDWNWLGTPPAGFSQSLYTYCVDVLNNETDPQDVTVKSTDVLAATDTAPGAGAKIAWLVNTYAATVHATGTNAQAAGLQLAIWETLYDSAGGTFDFGTGFFFVKQASMGAIDAANGYLTNLYASNGTGHAIWLDSPEGHGQDQVTVPEPSTLALLMLGAGLVFAFRRKSAPTTMTMA